jgi:hypothetical protein
VKVVIAEVMLGRLDLDLRHFPERVEFIDRQIFLVGGRGLGVEVRVVVLQVALLL